MTAVREYVSRPIRIEAVQWDGNLAILPDSWRSTAVFTTDADTGELLIPTLEGVMPCRVGDYVVRGTAAEFYPVRKPIFEHKYEPAS